MHICMYVCMYVHMYVWMHACTCGCVYVCMCVVFMYVHMFVRVLYKIMYCTTAVASCLKRQQGQLSTYCVHLYHSTFSLIDHVLQKRSLSSEQNKLHEAV